MLTNRGFENGRCVIQNCVLWSMLRSTNFVERGRDDGWSAMETGGGRFLITSMLSVVEVESVVLFLLPFLCLEKREK